jgi:hypothetical protein
MYIFNKGEAAKMKKADAAPRVLAQLILNISAFLAEAITKMTGLFFLHLRYVFLKHVP